MASVEPKIAVLVHVGALAPLAEILGLLRNFDKARTPVDLFFNLVTDRVPVFEATNLIHRSFPTAVILPTENRGMDIGGFFALLPKVLNKGYDYLLKLHTKTDPNWRRGLMQPLLGTDMAIKQCLTQFKVSPRVGLICARRHLYLETLGRKPNAEHLASLCTKYRVRNNSTFFSGGTVFWVRMSILEKTFGGVDLKDLYLSLNTLETLDTHWYKNNYNYLPFPKTITGVQLHWETIGKSSGLFPNSLAAREKRGRAILDGQIEHAFERFFGLITIAQGLQVLGI